MKRPSDTPPDGDFARYIEQLNASAAAATLKRGTSPVAVDQRIHASFRPGGGGGVRAAPDPVVGITTMKAATPQPGAGASFWTVAKWIVIPWLGLQLASRWVPQLSWLAGPVGLAVLIWLMYRLRKVPSGALLQNLHRRIRQAAQELEPRK